MLASLCVEKIPQPPVAKLVGECAEFSCVLYSLLIHFLGFSRIDLNFGFVYHALGK